MIKPSRLFLLLSVVLCSTPALAANLKSVHLISHQSRYVWGHAGSQSTSFTAEYEARDQGLDHICEVRYSVDGWRTSAIANATFDRTVGNYERWKVNVGVAGFRTPFLHVFTCRDLGGRYQVYSPSLGANVTSYGLTISSPVFVANSTY